jgi:hypothetical protein
LKAKVLVNPLAILDLKLQPPLQPLQKNILKKLLFALFVIAGAIMISVL